MTIYAVSFKYMQNLNEHYEVDADPVYSEPELICTCECTDEDEAYRFARGQDPWGFPSCDPSCDVDVDPVKFISTTHYDAAAVKQQLTEMDAIVASW